MALEILYEDKRMLALNKPSGQLVIPGRGESPGLPLAHELEERLKKKIFVVHRLDRGASGVVLFAKDATMHRRLSGQFENREIEKSYLVLAQGRLEGSGTVDSPIKAFGSGRMGVHPTGKPSRTDYRVLESFPNATLLEVSPHSGRRHQIRVHLYSLGHPVMGDPLYGEDRPVGGCARLMLHAWTIACPRAPAEPLRVKAEPPADFQEIVSQFRAGS